MTPEAFGTGMRMMEEVWGKPASEGKTIAYWTALSHLDDTVWEGAVRRALQSEEWFPTPAKLLSHAQHLVTQAGFLPGESAEKAWGQVLDLVREYGVYRVDQVVYPDELVEQCVRLVGGYQKLCLADQSEMVWLRKEFIALYDERRETWLERHPDALTYPLPPELTGATPRGVRDAGDPSLPSALPDTAGNRVVDAHLREP